MKKTPLILAASIATGILGCPTNPQKKPQTVRQIQQDESTKKELREQWEKIRQKWEKMLKSAEIDKGANSNNEDKNEPSIGPGIGPLYPDS